MIFHNAVPVHVLERRTQREIRRAVHSRRAAQLRGELTYFCEKHFDESLIIIIGETQQHVSIHQVYNCGTFRAQSFGPNQ